MNAAITNMAWGRGCVGDKDNNFLDNFYGFRLTNEVGYRHFRKMSKLEQTVPPYTFNEQRRYQATSRVIAQFFILEGLIKPRWKYCSSIAC